MNTLFLSVNIHKESSSDFDNKPLRETKESQDISGHNGDFGAAPYSTKK